jgi:integrase
MTKKNRYPGVTKRGATWSFRAQFNEEGERWGVSGSGYSTAKEAWNARNDAVKAARKQRSGAPVLRDMTLAEYLDHWVADHGRTVKETTSWGYDHALRSITRHPLAARRLTSLGEKEYRTILTDLLADNAWSTVQRKRTVLRTALDAAVRSGLLDANPVQHVRIARTDERTEAAAWDLATTQRFLRQRKYANDPLYPVWHLALATGLRRGELHGLRWSDVDFERGLLYVRRQRTEVGGRVVEQYPKTAGSEAPVHLDQETLFVLSTLRAARWTVGFDEDSYIVLDPRTGRPYHSLLTFRKDWERAVKNAAVPPIKFHGIRHTSASVMAELGIPLAAAQQRLRHWSQAMTRHYTHVANDQARKTADQLGQALTTKEAS